MLDLKDMVAIYDEEQDITYVMNYLEANDLADSNPMRFTIDDMELTTLEHQSSTQVETGYISHMYLDEYLFEVEIIERLFTSGTERLSNLIIE